MRASRAVVIRDRKDGSVARTLLKHYPGRTALGVVLMSSQAFIYNAIFFTYALVLTKFYGVSADSVGLYILPFALGNFLGPVLLGPLFDSLGRKTMIAATYALAGILLAATGQLFHRGVLTAVTQTVMWTVVFFFASAAASAAYLTVGECFPLEIRAMAIAVFYAIGTGVGGTGLQADASGRARRVERHGSHYSDQARRRRRCQSRVARRACAMTGRSVRKYFL